MLHLTDCTFKEHPSINLEFLIDFIIKEKLTEINWWNSKNFSSYFENLKMNPWEILDRIHAKLENFSNIVDVSCFQLSNNLTFSEEIIADFFSQIKNKRNLSVKIYDPLNDIANIKKILKIAKNQDLKIIGGVFLRPDMEEYPDCHIDVIDFYISNNIKQLSLIEPLGLLKLGDITKIIDKISNKFDKKFINFSFKTIKNHQPFLLKEALDSDIENFDFTLLSQNFGLPDLDVILSTIIFSNKKNQVPKSFFELIHKVNSSEMFKKNSNSLKKISNSYLLYYGNHPINYLKEVISLIKFTNLKFDFVEILNESKKTQLNLGNPPLIDPFSKIILSQSIFKLQEKKYEIHTLDLQKFIAGYWGKSPKNFNDEFIEIEKKINSLKNASTIHKKIEYSDIVNQELFESNKMHINESKHKISFLISPEEASYFFNEYSERSKILDFSEKSNLANLIFSLIEYEKNDKRNIRLNEGIIKSTGLDDKWRSLTRLMLMGR
jgi:pyruvate/oxaloacetate carboxyltransferase